MDSSQPQSKPEDACDRFEIPNEADNPNETINMSIDKSEVCIQLEGSHTTATETETESKHHKTTENLKFEMVEAPTELSCENQTEKITKASNIKLQESFQKKDLIKTQPKSVQFEKVKDQQKSSQKDLHNIGKENEDIAERFKQIMELFDTFTKNLESLDFSPTPSTSEGNMSGMIKESKPEDYLESRHPAKRSVDYYNQQEKEISVMENKFKTESKESQAYVAKCSISTDMINDELSSGFKTTQTLACQTSFNEHTSNIDLDGSSSTLSDESKSKFQNYLNNSANAENICLSSTKNKEPPYNSSKFLKKLNKTITETVPIIELTSPLKEEPARNPVHIINIDATSSSPSSSDLRRPTLCQRLWIVIRDFLAAAFLCLQVDRGCILYLGFFVAFVVSASFVTAFIYRTLNMSPSLLESSALPSSSSAQHFTYEQNKIIGK